MPQRLLRACAAPAVLALAGAIAAAAPAAHPSAADAARTPSRPGAGDVAIARQRLDVVAGRRAMVAGHVVGAAAGRAVALQRRSGGRWRTIDRDRAAADGGFAFRFRPQTPGSAPVRVRSGTAHEHVGRLNVYRRAQVSWYGPGLYGGHLGCGGTLTPGTLGVANKTLPCGTKVTLRHRGRTVRVPVVDRGPYSGGREFDLTAATKDRLGFSGVGSILVTR
jgi:peptidoglycan lytic transglycosylase